MRLSLGWLREWVDWGGDEGKLLERLPLRGFEIESVTPFAVAFRGVRLARIVRAQPLAGHEGAVFELDHGAGDRPRVVSGDPRLAPGDWVAYAPPGARVATGEIRPRTIGGVTSEGMLTSWSELGLGREHDRVLVVPDPGAPAGTPFDALLGVGETLVELAVTPNRGDCMSVHGLAREIAALFRVPLLRRPPPPVAGPWLEDLRIEDPEACSWFGLFPVSGVRPRRLSLRRRLRLEQAGVSSQHPLVDLTNYVLLELGEPLHAFDAASLAGGVHVRWGREGETLELLGGERLALGPTHLVVADETGARSLAGVLGGKTSALGEETQTAWVEAAHFRPRALGRRPERLRIVTDAAQRFERGVDPTLPPVALAHLLELLREEGVGTLGGPIRRAVGCEPERRKIVLPAGETGRRLGCEEDGLDIRAQLEALGLELRVGREGYQALVPPHRFDLEEPIDLVEEVARLYGYENIAPAIPRGRLAAEAVRDQTPRHRLEERVRRFLTARGYDECRHLALVEPESLKSLDPELDPVVLENPLSRETAALATTLWSRLLRTARENLHRQQEAVRLFEIGTVFLPQGAEVEERRVLAVLGTGAAWPARWCHEKRPYDFYDLKGDLDDLLRVLGGREGHASPNGYSWNAGRHPALNPYACARLRLGEHDAGLLGSLHPEQAKTFDLSGDIFISSIDINKLYDIHQSFYEDPPRYPMVVRDLAFVLPAERTVGDLVGLLRAEGGEILRALEVFDVYSGRELPEGRRSIAVRLTCADSRGTLSDDKVAQLLACLVKAVEGGLGGQVRR